MPPTPKKNVFGNSWVSRICDALRLEVIAEEEPGRVWFEIYEHFFRNRRSMELKSLYEYLVK